MLRPISQNHSISKVIANLFVPQSLLKPKYTFDKLVENQKLHDYQRKGLLTTKFINLDNNNISNDEINGFIFEEFDNMGKPVSILKVENVGNKANINFENRSYTSWNDFKSKFYYDIDILIEDLEIYVEAISLNYIDEFIWDSQSKIDVKEVFDSKSEFLNSSFIDSHNGTFIVISQSDKKESFQFEEEKTEVLFNNDIKRVVINHTFAIKLDEIKIYKSDKNLLQQCFETAHAKNKELLKKILTTKNQKLIKLI